MQLFSGASFVAKNVFVYALQYQVLFFTGSNWLGLALQYFYACEEWYSIFFINRRNKTQKLYTILQIKPCGLGSRIRDMEAESYNWSHLMVNIMITFYFFL